MWTWLSKIMVCWRVESLDVQPMPGLPVAAKFAQAVAMVLASACACSVLPVA